ncbi:MAG: polysaccharide deacetylase family protein [Bacteroidetes bacterium]|nr:polysaccharide deacetylase family protein [Bacteroidota bacterium]MBL7105504.1 polysaccharide deacetylase family protein [Bacteroidales bacterium]
MYFVKTPKIITLLYRNLIWEIPNTEKKIYLTFDDGPDKDVTLQILEILDNYKTKATFFCLGKKAEKNPEIISQILSCGHKIGNHTYNHLNGRKTNSGEYLQDIKKCDKILDTKLFRPPYGKITRKQIKELKDNYKIILWTVLPGDFHKNVTKEQCYKRSIRHTKSGTIIVFHDNIQTEEKVLYVLPKFLEHFISKGYTFEPINDELFI